MNFVYLSPVLSTFYLVLCVDKVSDIPRAKVTVVCLVTPPQWVPKHRVQKESGREWRFRAPWKILPFPRASVLLPEPSLLQLFQLCSPVRPLLLAATSWKGVSVLLQPL